MTSVKHNGEVEFRFFRAGARDVRLAGDFTQWQDNAIAMRHEGNGWWSMLAVGMILSVLGALLSLATDSVGGFVALIGGIVVITGSAFGFPTRS